MLDITTPFQAPCFMILQIRFEVLILLLTIDYSESWFHDSMSLNHTAIPLFIIDDSFFVRLYPQFLHRYFCSLILEMIIPFVNTRCMCSPLSMEFMIFLELENGGPDT